MLPPSYKACKLFLSSVHQISHASLRPVRPASSKLVGEIKGCKRRDTSGGEEIHHTALERKIEDRASRAPRHSSCTISILTEHCTLMWTVRRSASALWPTMWSKIQSQCLKHRKRWKWRITCSTDGQTVQDGYREPAVALTRMWSPFSTSVNNSRVWKVDTGPPKWRCGD